MDQRQTAYAIHFECPVHGKSERSCACAESRRCPRPPNVVCLDRQSGKAQHYFGAANVCRKAVEQFTGCTSNLQSEFRRHAHRLACNTAADVQWCLDTVLYCNHVLHKDCNDVGNVDFFCAVLRRFGALLRDADVIAESTYLRKCLSPNNLAEIETQLLDSYEEIERLREHAENLRRKAERYDALKRLL